MIACLLNNFFRHPRVLSKECAKGQSFIGLLAPILLKREHTPNSGELPYLG
jgi:hypothetical protein